MSRVKSAACFANEAAKRHFYEVVGERLRAVREDLGLGQSDIARVTGASQSTVNNAEIGQSCSLYTLVLIAEAMDVTLDELIPLEALP